MINVTHVILATRDIILQYGDSRSFRLTFDKEIVDNLIKVIKKELPNQLSNIDVMLTRLL